MPLPITVRNTPVVLTDETLAATWKWFADLSRACAKGALEGEFFCNDPESYAAEQKAEAKRYDAHEGTISVTFIQRAYFIQSGESLGLLS